jgi:hypothetical protein
MLDFKSGAMTPALFATTAIFRPSAQPPLSGNDAESGDALSFIIADESVATSGAAFKRVIEIENPYAPKVEAAPTPDERRQPGNQEINAAMKVISDQELTVDDYDNVRK